MLIDPAKLSKYTIEEHRHRYACWTAARAVQRGYSAKTQVIRKAIEKSGLQEDLAKLHTNTITADEFDRFHQGIAIKLIDYLKDHAETSYGRAAKIIAIYIKTVHVLAHPDSALSRVAHPPIDGILLKYYKLDIIKWTDLKEEAYKNLIADFRKLIGTEPFWKLEDGWSPERR